MNLFTLCLTVSICLASAAEDKDVVVKNCQAVRDGQLSLIVAEVKGNQSRALCQQALTHVTFRLLPSSAGNATGGGQVLCTVGGPMCDVNFNEDGCRCVEMRADGVYVYEYLFKFSAEGGGGGGVGGAGNSSGMAAAGATLAVSTNCAKMSTQPCTNLREVVKTKFSEETMTIVIFAVVIGVNLFVLAMIVIGVHFYVKHKRAKMLAAASGTGQLGPGPPDKKASLGQLSAGVLGVEGEGRGEESSVIQADGASTATSEASSAAPSHGGSPEGSEVSSAVSSSVAGSQADDAQSAVSAGDSTVT